MTKKKSKARKYSKRKMERAAKKTWRREKRREALEQVKSYMVMRRNFRKPSTVDADVETEDRENDREIRLDDEIAFYECDGVGQCCLDRPLALEPGDVLRLMKNDAFRETFGIESTKDLYRKNEDGKPLLVRVYDEKSGLPACFAVPVFLGKDDDSQTACPFYLNGDVAKCHLGEDRLTQCTADPVVRLARMNGKRQIEGWSYALNDIPCMGCPKACSDKMHVCDTSDWLIEKGMGGVEGRFTESDTYTAFCDWLKRKKYPMPLNRMAVELLYNWNAVVDEHPRNAVEHITSTRRMLEEMSAQGWAEKYIEEQADEHSEPDKGDQNAD
jgi:hypothetical protein